jgi:hypothetical protein
MIAPNWVKCYSEEYGIPFYWNPDTEESVWELLPSETTSTEKPQEMRCRCAESPHTSVKQWKRYKKKHGENSSRLLEYEFLCAATDCCLQCVVFFLEVAEVDIGCKSCEKDAISWASEARHVPDNVRQRVLSYLQMQKTLKALHACKSHAGASDRPKPSCNKNLPRPSEQSLQSRRTCTQLPPGASDRPKPSCNKNLPRPSEQSLQSRRTCTQLPPAPLMSPSSLQQLRTPPAPPTKRFKPSKAGAAS